jgi:isopenicillin-N N-acyltransferase-like protein
MDLLELPRLTVTGSPAAMGEAQGRALGEPIRAFVHQRLRAARAYLYAQGLRDDGGFRAVGSASLATLANWDPAGRDEHDALAQASAVDPVDLHLAANLTDLRDALLYGAPGRRPDAEGCTVVLLPRERWATHHVVAAQTWDLNPPDLEFVVAIHRRPSDGPASWTVTCAGCPSLMSLNEAGVAVGTTNIKTRDVRPDGVAYLNILHRLARSADRQEAALLLDAAPRAAAHTYWCADVGGSWRAAASARQVVRDELAVAPIVQTNHCQHATFQTDEAEAASASSRARLARMSAIATGGRHSVASLRSAFADRSDGIDSINRFAEDGQGTSTNACFIAIPAERCAWACRGSADRGRWLALRPGRD